MPHATARVIYIIRHGEKPPDPPRRPIPPQPTSGDDIYGNSGSASSLTPTGWQRAGAIGTLFFAPPGDSLRPGFLQPSQLISPNYGSGVFTHRTYQTIYPLSLWLNLTIENPYKEGHEAKLGRKLAAQQSGITLICWEHKAIHLIANAIAPNAKIPQCWPPDRFDVVWMFTLQGSTYDFTPLPEMVIAGDSLDPTWQCAPGSGESASEVYAGAVM